MLFYERGNVMKSKTKYQLDFETVKKLFFSAKIENISAFSPLGLGMFNSVYEVMGDREYVLKISPKTDLPVMKYENDMLKTELYWYDVISENTDIFVPEIYYSDFTRKYVDANWFIMEKIDGVTRNKLDLPQDEKLKKSVEIISKIHNMQGEKFGYVQNGLHNNWYEALRSMIVNLLSDADKFGKPSKNGKKLLSYCDNYKNILEKAPCTAVNYDLWDANLICKNTKNGTVFTLIDPERSFWGDPVFDFLCLEDFVQPIEKKEKSVNLHNILSNVKIEINDETKIRYAFAQGLMGLIQEVERYYRFTHFSQGWILDTFSNKISYNSAFKVLENGK